MEPRGCALEGCEEKFVPKRKTQLFCSPAHAQTGSNLRRGERLTSRLCAWCGQDFQQGNIRQRFCCADHGKAFRNSGNRSKQEVATGGIITPDNLPKRLRQLDELLKRKGIDLADLEAANIRRVNFWQQGFVDQDGEGQTLDLAGISISPSWESGPEWPVVQRGPAIKVAAPTAKPKAPKKGAWQTAVILPDIQAGYFRGPDDTMVPTHDESAIAVARAIVQDAQPDLIVMNGDNLDLPEFGKYRLTPTYARTTQATVDRVTRLCAELRSDAPDARIIWIEGNHEKRLSTHIIDNAVAAFGLKRPGEAWPVMSVPHLCRFEDFRVEFVPGYPANEFWINDRLRVIHGHKVNSKGSTASRYLDSERVSTIYGHVHRREWAERTRHTRDGARTTLAASAGCLCRIDGAVPSTKGGYDLDGLPMTSHEDWQQGVMVVAFQPGDGVFSVEMVSIFDGWARWRDTEYRA